MFVCVCVSFLMDEIFSTETKNLGTNLNDRMDCIRVTDYGDEWENKHEVNLLICMNDRKFNFWCYSRLRLSSQKYNYHLQPMPQNMYVVFITNCDFGWQPWRQITLAHRIVIEIFTILKMNRIENGMTVISKWKYLGGSIDVKNIYATSYCIT